jgi:site-specific DNA recombinase
MDDQIRRCREYITQGGGAPDAAKLFTDFAISGASLDRPGFEAMMAAVTGGMIKAIVTEDLSGISRDFADSAMTFKRLEFRQVPLVGVADGIDTSPRGAKMAFTFKSLMSEMYLDDLRDKTLRGLEGRALAAGGRGRSASREDGAIVAEGATPVRGERRTPRNRSRRSAEIYRRSGGRICLCIYRIFLRSLPALTERARAHL